MALPADAGELGLVHRDGTVVRYWTTGFVIQPRLALFGWYVWDQVVTVQVIGPDGRAAARVHFPLIARREKPNKTVPCKFAGEKLHLRSDGTATTACAIRRRLRQWSTSNRPRRSIAFRFRGGDYAQRVPSVRHRPPAVFPSACRLHDGVFHEAGDIASKPSAFGVQSAGGGTDRAIVTAVESLPNMSMWP